MTPFVAVSIFDVREKVEKSTVIVHMGSIYLDSLLSMKFTEIKNNHVNLTYEVGAGEYRGIEELDLCSILGNLLDNAMEAVMLIGKENRRINLNIRCDEHKVMIMVKNTAPPNLKESDVLRTSKADKKSHGLGIKIVRELAEKYGGRFNWTVKDNEFQANVILFSK